MSQSLFASLIDCSAKFQSMGPNWDQKVNFCGVPNGIRTRVTAVKGRCPRPLDDGDVSETGVAWSNRAVGRNQAGSCRVGNRRRVVDAELHAGAAIPIVGSE